ncbi:MAG: phage holin family protein [Myxococcota bacterium]
MLLRFFLQTVLTAGAVGLVTWWFPGVSAASVGTVVACGLLVGLVNAGVRPMLRFALHPVTVSWVVLMILLVNAFAVILAEPFTRVWAFGSFLPGAAAVLLISAVSAIVAIVPMSRTDRRLAWGLNERKTPGASPIERRPQLEDPTTAH